MAVAYKVYDSNNKLIDVFGKQQLCDFATEHICSNEGAYTEEAISKVLIAETQNIPKVQVIVRKVIRDSEYVGTVKQSKLVLKVTHHKVKEVELY